MGWIDWSWWMKEEEKPAEPLVLGAELECEYGSQRSFLMVETDGISINDLPKACVEDSIAHRNIHPFGKCLKNDECYFKMDLEERWVNAEPQTERVNGKEIITTSSTLICKASGMAIRAVTSGQDGRFARFQQFLRNMERKYPGLRETLEDPYGSVYLEGNYEMALQFLEEQIEGREEGLEIVTLYDPKNLEGAYILAALERLMTDCEVRSFEGFMNDLRDTANQHGMQGKEGWDQNYLNEAMMELLRKDCKETAERIETNPVYRGMEKHKMFGSWLRECTEAFAYTTVMYSSALAEGNSSGRRMEGDKGRGAVKKGEEKGKESGSVKGSSEMGGERVDGKGGSKGGSSSITNDILECPRTGSALKIDDVKPIRQINPKTGRPEIIKEFPATAQSHGFNDLVDNYAGHAAKSQIPNGTLYQLDGALNGVQGRFEWIIQDGNVTHRMFIQNGTMNGVPIKP